MSAHSPGPWRWEKWGLEVDATWRLRDSGGDSVLRIHDGAHSRFPSKVDARLLEAAPEVLETLKGAVHALGLYDAPADLLAQYRAFIARIEGTQP